MPEEEEKLENVVRWTVTLPIALSIKVDIERKHTNDSKSSWIKQAIEEKLERSKQEEGMYQEIIDIKNDIKEIMKLLEVKKS